MKSEREAFQGLRTWLSACRSVHPEGFLPLNCTPWDAAEGVRKASDHFVICFFPLDILSQTSSWVHRLLLVLSNLKATEKYKECNKHCISIPQT